MKFKDCNWIWAGIKYVGWIYLSEQCVYFTKFIRTHCQSMYCHWKAINQCDECKKYSAKESFLNLIIIHCTLLKDISNFTSKPEMQWYVVNVEKSCVIFHSLIIIRNKFMIVQNLKYVGKHFRMLEWYLMYFGLTKVTKFNVVSKVPINVEFFFYF